MVVEPVSFHVGPVSIAAARVLAVGTAAYAIGSGRFAWRAFRVGLQDRLSALMATLVMALLAVLLWVDGARLLPAPFSIVVLVMYVGAIVFTLTFTLGRYQEKIEAFRKRFGDRLNALLLDVVPEDRLARLEDLRSRFQMGPEQRRKAPHLLMGTFILFYLVAGFAALRALWETSYGGDPGMVTDGVGEGIQNLYAISHGAWLAGGHIFGLVCLLSVLYILVPTELLRLRYPELSYPFKPIILSRLRKREQGLFGAHYYIAATLPLAVMWLTRDSAAWDVTVPAVLAVFAVTVFADSASALVGVRWGRRKWFHNPGKTYLGSAGGTLVAFAVAVPFVGWTGALLAAIVFLVVDVVAPVPIFISDNILNPVALAATFTLAQGTLAPLIPYY